MANMFSGNQEKKIPKSFKDCYKTDGLTQNLWLWCERLENWGKILFWVLIVGGLILSISTSIVEKEVVVREATYWSEAETELRKTFDFEIFIQLLLETALYAFLEYCAYHILALLVGSLATIVQHTKITANISLYKFAKAEGVVDVILDDNSETDTNNNQTTICDKNTHKKFILEIKNTETNSENAHWETVKLTGTKILICNHCGKKLLKKPAIAQICTNCGKTISFSFDECTCGCKDLKYKYDDN